MTLLQKLLASEVTWVAIAMLLGYAANSIVSRGWLAKMPPTSPLRRGVRALHGFLNKVDPMILALAVALPLLSGCAGTLEETRGQVRLNHLVGLQVASRDDATCRNLSSKERIWTGITVAGTALSGATGIATIPVDSKRGDQLLAAGTVVAATGAVVGLALQQSYAREWQSEGCEQ